MSVKVSILCVCYNHSKYIEKTINSFLNQSCDFEFEVIVYDDLSTDNSREIIDEICEKHSNIVRMYTDENLYSKGIRTLALSHLSPNAKGEYLAFCEGDDYWIDNTKLQKQFDALEGNPNIDLCFHPAYSEDPEGNRELVSNHFEGTHYVSTDEVILGDGDYCPTASLFIRKSALSLASSSTIKLMPCGDYFMQIMSSVKGGGVYLPEPMSVYRINQKDSFSTRISSSSHENQRDFLLAMANSLESLKQDLDGVNLKSFSNRIRKYKQRARKSQRKAIKERIRNLIFSNPSQ
ncbi:glycosyltransferase [Vibrio alginolyticus]|uniref:glycosyltransferase family 2 protein n=1 Tax=Vibrio alginolyticus TaxID=663 RepID=UPI0021604787|nr:glycosyltransferase family A protein [Vibrio alginolyticus]MCS0085020.1 glycosyltransferase [Vibrio alginolyticus]